MDIYMIQIRSKDLISGHVRFIGDIDKRINEDFFENNKIL